MLEWEMNGAYNYAYIILSNREPSALYAYFLFMVLKPVGKRFDQNRSEFKKFVRDH